MRCVVWCVGTGPWKSAETACCMPLPFTHPVHISQLRGPTCSWIPPFFQQIKADYKEPCGQCKAVNWGISDEARYYCKTCHNVIERTTEIVGPVVPGMSKASSISRKNQTSIVEQQRKWMVCEGFQFILKHQAQALLKLGVHQTFKDDILCQLWRIYLQKSRQAYTYNPVRTAKFHVRNPGSESDSAAVSVVSASETGDEEGDGDSSKRSGSASGMSSEDGQSSVWSGSEDAASYLTSKHRRSQGLMTMPKTLALCYLGLLWARESITLSDLLRFVNEGHIPYLNAFERFPAEMRLYGKDALIFCVQSIPSHSALHKESQSLVSYLELPTFPPVTRHCLLHPELLTLRYLTVVNLPDELHDWVIRVMKIARMEEETYQTCSPRSSHGLPHYDLQAAALIIITMKLLFKMDDRTEWDLSNDAADLNKKDSGKENNRFSVRKWFKVLQPALNGAKRAEQHKIAMKGWKPDKPLVSSKDAKAFFMKKRRLAEQVQVCFKKLSDSPPESPASPSSFRFRWNGKAGGDGPSLQHQKLGSAVLQEEGSLTPSNTDYWHTALRRCSPRSCRSHFNESVDTLPKSYVWLLELFSFLLGVKPSKIHDEVIKAEKRFLKSHHLRRPKKYQRRPSGRETKTASSQQS